MYMVQMSHVDKNHYSHQFDRNDRLENVQRHTITVCVLEIYAKSFSLSHIGDPTTTTTVTSQNAKRRTMCGES